MTRTVQDIPHKKLEDLMHKAIEDVEEDVQHFLNNLKEESYKKYKEKVKLEINSRLKTTGGRFCQEYHFDELIDVKIELHPEIPEDKVSGILKHEALHLILQEGHTSLFRKLCRFLEIPLRHGLEFDSAEDYKYYLYCSSCGELVAKRKRKSKLVKSTEKYFSTCCSSYLELQEV